MEDSDGSMWRRRYRENRGRASCDQRDAIKIVEIDTYSRYSNHVTNGKHVSHGGNKREFMQPSRLSLSRPSKAQYEISMAKTPPPMRMKHHVEMNSDAKGNAWTPNYMAATASAKARSRSQSRSSTPEKDRLGSIRKRLSFPLPNYCDT